MIKITHTKLIYLIMLIIIFCTDSFIVFANVDTRIRTVFQGLLGLSAIYIAFTNKKYSIKSIVFLLIAISCVLCTSIFKQDFSNGNIVKMVLLVIGMIVVNGIDFKTFRNVFCDIIIVICGFSLFTFLLSFFVHNYGPFPVVENTSHTKMVFLGLSNISLSYGIPRNAGPFWEPGVYSIYLALAVLFELIRSQRITKKVILLLVGIVTTLSTSGYVMIVILLAYYMLGGGKSNDHKKGRWVRCRTTFLMLGLFLILLTQNENLNRALFSKLKSGNHEYISTIARVSSVFGNLNIWLKNPLFGVGPTRLQEVYNNYLFSKGYSANSNTNGLLIMFSMYGTVLGLCTVYGLLKTVAVLDKTTIGRIIVFVLLACMLFTEPLTTSCLFNILIFYGICVKKDNFDVSIVDKIVNGQSIEYSDMRLVQIKKYKFTLRKVQCDKWQMLKIQK